MTFQFDGVIYYFSDILSYSLVNPFSCNLPYNSDLHTSAAPNLLKNNNSNSHANSDNPGAKGQPNTSSRHRMST